MVSKKMKALRKNNCREVKEIDDDHAAYLPEDLIIESILTRLPVRTLAQYSCVSKLWYNSIFNDPQFAKTHFANSKNRNLNLFVQLLNVWVGRPKSSFFSVGNDYEHRLLCSLKMPATCEPVGNCDGLVCITQGRKDAHGPALMLVVNPSRAEIIALPYFHPRDRECEYLCHGLGFDSLSGEYKVVIIFTLKYNVEFITMVFTLGTKSWRSIVTSVAEISPPPGCSPFPRQMVTEVWGNIRTPATLCGGALFWRITNREVEEDEIIIAMIFIIIIRLACCSRLTFTRRRFNSFDSRLNVI
ncbi:putative F-box protein At1g47790 [Papaver somniferum]|uniref:putative F-box protein At1g47790 n=1 Tax=Papaver somniferum TaxID=3469 RepID=UPI000E6F9768|nr:putative F-box protein At1g47790 [Papaver somniferum]